MNKDKSNEGLRRHRPRKLFRFEYIKGKYSAMARKERELRRWGQWEEEEIRIQVFDEHLERLKKEQNH